MAVRTRAWRLMWWGWLALTLQFCFAGKAFCQAPPPFPVTIPNLAPVPGIVAPPTLPLPSTSFQNGKKFFARGGQAVPLFWAYGMAQRDQLDDYKESGFNTLVVPVPWENTPDGTLTPGDLKKTRALAEAGAARGLFILYQLPAAPAGLENSLRITSDSQSYTLLWSNWTAGAIAQLKDTPRLLGWMLPDDPRGLPIFDNNGFTRWLKTNYADVNVLNAQWGTNFESLDEITLDTAASLAEDWEQNGNTAAVSLTGLPLPGGSRPAVAQTWAFHPAALAAALYRADSYRSLLTFWVGNVREAAPEAPLFSGRLPDYAQLLAMPAGIDVSVPDLPPGVAEADALTHNPQAIAIARRAGRYAAIPTLATNGNPALAAADLPRFVASWMDAALAHGASGIAFASWPDLQRNTFLRRTIAANIARLQTPPFNALWNQAPQSTAAIVLTPLAEGQHAQNANLDDNAPAAKAEGEEKKPDTGTGRGLYGFGDSLVSGEPNNLVFALRWGSAFGPVDFLAPEDIAEADLNRYNTLLLPQAISLPDSVAQRLTKYALDGGIVVADLGLGAAQAGGRAAEPPPALSTLFGLAPLQLRRDDANFQIGQPSKLLQSWSAFPPGRWLTGVGVAGPAFTDFIASGPPRPGTQVLALTRMPRPGDDAAEAAQTAYLTFHPISLDGGALFAPVRLWQRWGPGNLGFDGFHGDLFSHGAQIVQRDALAFVPANGIMGQPNYAETVNFPDAIALLNHNTTLAEAPPIVAPNQPPFAATPPNLERDWSQVQTNAPGEWLWTNVITAFSPAGATPAAGLPHSAPHLGIGDETPQIILLHALTPPGAMLVSQMVPVRVRHLTGGPLMARLMEWQPQKASFALWPNATAFTPQGGTFNITPGEAGGLRVVLYDAQDGYRIAPNSRHKVTITTLALPAQPEPPVPLLLKPEQPKGKEPPKGGRAAPNPKANPKANPKGQPPAPTIPPPISQEIIANAQGQLIVETFGAALMIEIVPQP